MVQLSSGILILPECWFHTMPFGITLNCPAGIELAPTIGICKLTLASILNASLSKKPDLNCALKLWILKLLTPYNALSLYLLGGVKLFSAPKTSTAEGKIDDPNVWTLSSSRRNLPL